MGKTSTIKPQLAVIKSIYEKLERGEKDLMNQIDPFTLVQENELKRVANELPYFSVSPSESSIRVILDYSKEYSQMDTMI